MFWLEFRLCFGVKGHQRVPGFKNGHLDMPDAILKNEALDYKNCPYFRGDFFFTAIFSDRDLGRPQSTQNNLVANFSVRKRARKFSAQTKNFLRWSLSLFFWMLTPRWFKPWPFYIFLSLIWRSLNLSKGHKRPSQKGHKELPGQ